MPSAGQQSIQGRCPTCGQVVTLSVEARVQLVECPRCGHQATGALFVDLEAPLPVVVVQSLSPDPERRSSRWAVPDAIEDSDDEDAADAAASPSVGGVFEPSAFDEAAFDAAISGRAAADSSLAEPFPTGRGASVPTASARAASVPVASSPAQASISGSSAGPRDERTLLMGDERTLLMGDDRTLLMSDDRTRLMLESPFLKGEGRASEAPVSSAAGRRGAASKLTADDGERTHLLLDPLDLYDDRETALTRMTASLRPFAQRALQLSLALDARMHGRWKTALLVVAVAAGLLPPLFDYLTDDPASTLSLITTVLSVLGFAVFMLAWLGKLLRDDGAWDLRVAGVRVQTATQRFMQDLQALGRSPRYLKLHLFGELLVLIGLAGLMLAGLRSIVRLVLGASDPASVLRFVSGLLLLGAVLLLRAGLRAAPKGAPGPVELGESMEAARKMPAIIDLSEPLPSSFIGDDTPLHRILFALSEWRAREWLDERGYQAALERHLQRHLPGCRVERERWLGRERRAGIADLVVDDLVLIEVAHGFRQPCAERAIATIECHARTWPNKPLLLAIFDASREAVLESGATAALVELHRRLPLVTVRMPTRRR
jgi:hypothetical protein